MTTSSYSTRKKSVVSVWIRNRWGTWWGGSQRETICLRVSWEGVLFISNRLYCNHGICCCGQSTKRRGPQTLSCLLSISALPLTKCWKVMFFMSTNRAGMPGHFQIIRFYVFTYSRSHRVKHLEGQGCVSNLNLIAQPKLIWIVNHSIFPYAESHHQKAPLQ